MQLTDTHTGGLWIVDTKDGVIYGLDEMENEDWLSFKSVDGTKGLKVDYDNLTRGIDNGVFKLVGRG